MQFIGNMDLWGSQNTRNIQILLFFLLVSLYGGRNGLPWLKKKCEWTKNEKNPETSVCFLGDIAVCKSYSCGTENAFRLSLVSISRFSGSMEINT